MATTAPTPWWSMGNVVQYTKEGSTYDDTEQWSLGNILSFLEYATRPNLYNFIAKSKTFNFIARLKALS